MEVELLGTRWSMTNVKIYAENETIPNGFIEWEGTKIIEFGDMTELREKENVLSLPEGFNVLPGFIDLHIHGVNGVDTMDGTPQSLKTFTTTLPKEGTTSFLPTTITNDVENIERALTNVGQYVGKGQDNIEAEILGIHLEGPFINPKNAGAQPVEAIIQPDISLFQRWQELSGNLIKLVTFAPEEDEDFHFTQHLFESGVTPSVGHSSATYEKVQKAMEHGLSHVTHLYNQMSPFHHREPGVVGAAFIENDLTVELIVDEIHSSRVAVQVAYDQITSDRLLLITDSMRAKGLPDGEYELGGQKVLVKDQSAVLENGTLAGSVVSMIDAVKNMQRITGCSTRDIIKMASENPAKKLHQFHRKGSIANGKDADLVVLDNEMNVYMTICRGEIAYSRGEIR